jgi:hypothetical protein
VSKKLRILYSDGIRIPVLYWIRGSGFGNPDLDPGRPKLPSENIKNLKLSYFENLIFTLESWRLLLGTSNPS